MNETWGDRKRHHGGKNTGFVFTLIPFLPDDLEQVPS